MANEQIKFEFTAINKTAAAFSSIQRGLGEMATAANLAKTGFASLIAIVSSGALLQMGRQALDAAGGLGEIASQTGASTRALQAYKFIALENGVTNEQMQKGFAQLTKRLGEAKLGSDKMVEVFGAIGVSGNQLASLTTDQAMLRIADAMSKIEDPAKRAALETQLFGKAGQALDPILRQGSAAIEEQTQKLSEMGVIMDDAMIAKADSAADKMAMLEEVVKTKLTIAVADNADAFVVLADAVGFAISAFSPFFKVAGDVVSGLDQMIDRLRTAKSLREGFNAVSEFATNVYTGNPVAARKKYVDGRIKGLPLFPEGMSFKPPKPSGLDVPQIFSSSGGGAAARKKVSAKKSTSILTAENYANPGDFRKALDDQYYADLAVNKNADTPLIQILPNADQLTAQISELKAPFRVIMTEAAELSESLGASFGNAFQNLVTGAEGFKSAFKSLANSIISELMRIFVTEQLVKSITGFFKSAFSFPLPGKAIGGPVQAGKPYMVGERGPEMFIPSRSGSIASNDKLGGSMVVNVDARGASDPAAVRRQVEQGIMEAAPLIIAAAQSRTLASAGRARLPGTIS